MLNVAFVFVAMTVQLGRIMGQSSTGSEDRGMIMTTVPFTSDSGAHIRSLTFMPYYDSEVGTMHGVKFQNSDITFLSADVDYRTKTLYLYDYYLRSIAVGFNFNNELDITNMTFDYFHVGVSSQTCQVAYNYVSQVLYWSDPTFNWIVAAPGQKALIPENWYKIIVHEHLTSPDGIAVESLEGLLFWTDTYVNPKIERANLDGSNRITLFDTGLLTPLSIEADHTSHKIFWVDQHKNSIESANYDGTGRVIVKRIQRAQFFDIAVFKDVLMVSDTGQGAGLMHVLNKTNGESLGALNFQDYGVREHIYGLAIYNIENQPMKDKDYCLMQNCQHMCISTKEGANCMCSDGFKLNLDGHTCDDDTGSYHRAFVLSTDTDIYVGDIRAVARHDYEVTSIFSIIPKVTMPPPSTRAATTPAPTTTRGLTSDTVTTSTTARTTRAPTTTVRPQTTARPTTPIRPIDKITMFDINMADRMIYFATTYNISRRAVDLRIQDSSTELIVTHSKPITGLVYDWIDPDNLYWCDSGAIYVTNVLRRRTETVVSSAGNDTKEVILLPHERKLAWLSGSPNKYEVKTVYVDGTGEIKTIGKGLINPIGLTRDQDNKKIYMIDDGTVKRVAYNETGEPKTFINTNGIDIVLYKSYFIIMSTKGSTSVFDSYNRRSLNNVNSGSFDDGLIFNDVKVMDETLQPNETSPCHHNNGGCEQICSSRFDGGEKAILKCTCTIGFSVDSANPANCISAGVTDMFILVTDWTHDGIYQVDLQTDVIHAVNIDMTGTPTGVIYNHKTNKIVFGEMYDMFVHQANLDGSETEILLKIESYTFPNRLDFDETTRNIYYTGNLMSHVGIITPRRTYIETLDTKYGFLGDIVLHPGHGRLYFSVEDSPSYIEMANMDGTSGVIIIENAVQNVKLEWPEGLAIDFKANKLYWSDGFHDTISRSELDGSQPTVILTDTAASMKDIVVDGTYLYYIAWNRPYITKVSLANPKSIQKIGENAELGRLDTMFIYQSNFPNKQPVNPLCADNNGLGDCSTICLPTYKGRTCACDYDVRLRVDKRTCEDVHQCDKTIGAATFADTCNRWNGTSCDYICPKDYEQTGNYLSVKCTLDGWNRRTETLCKEIPKCADTIDNGELSAGCTRRYNSKCDITCNIGYVAQRSYAVCLDTGAWDPTPICSEHVCKSKVVKHGSLTTTCSGTANEKCSYSCDNRYVPKPSTPTVTCGNDGAWSPDLDDICLDILCPATLSFGTLTDCKDRRIGSVCTFACKDGQRNNGFTTTVCKDTGEWHTGMDPCTDAVCQLKVVKHGSLSTGCAGKVNEECSYTCDKNYVPATTASSVKCTSSGTWSQDLATVCTGKQCPTTIPHGTINVCTLGIGSVCNYTCAKGYQKHSAVERVVCTDTFEWHTKRLSFEPCPALTCPATFGAVRVNSTCSGRPISVCDYTCEAPFVHSNKVTSIECTAAGTWDVDSKTLCKGPPPVVQAQTGANDNAEVVGLAVGVVVLGIVIVGIIIVLFLFRRRLQSGKMDGFATYSNGNVGGPSVAITNPGYSETSINALDNSKNDYASVDPNQMQPFSFPGGRSTEPSVDADSGFVNPVYEATQKRTEEPLPEYGTLDITAENVVLTKDSWLKEKAMGPDNVHLKD